MAELPEVEAARAAIAEHCSGKKIVRSMIAEDYYVIHRITRENFEASLNGKTIVAAERKGKHMWLVLDSLPFPTFYFGITGAVYIKGVELTKYKRSAVQDNDEWPPNYSKFLVELDDGLQLSFTDKRRFSIIRLLPEPVAEKPISLLGPDVLMNPLTLEEFYSQLSKKDTGIKTCLLNQPVAEKQISLLGPDVLMNPLTLEEFHSQLSKKDTGIKHCLLDQGFISVIGNWVADDVLYQARIHPLKKASSLSEGSCETLFNCIKEVIGKAVQVGADSSQFPSNWIFHSRKRPSKAFVDGKKVDFIIAAGRTTAYVPEMQMLSGDEATREEPQKDSSDRAKNNNNGGGGNAPEMAGRGDLKGEAKVTTKGKNPSVKGNPKGNANVGIIENEEDRGDEDPKKTASKKPSARNEPKENDEEDNKGNTSKNVSGERKLLESGVSTGDNDEDKNTRGQKKAPKKSKMEWRKRAQ